jgi:hypothetical protein
MEGAKIAAGITGVMMATTLVLPKRNTPAVFNAGGNFVTGVMSTAMGTGSGTKN